MPKSVSTSETGIDTSLHTAIEHGNFKEACDLVHAGADINEKNLNGDTPLHLLLQNEAGVSMEDRLRVVRLLLEHGAMVDQQNACSETALHLAAWKGYIDVVKLLLQYQSKVDQQNKFGRTALHLAAGKGYIEVIKLLLQHKAKIDQQNAHSETVLHLAVKNGHLALIKLLLQHGAAVDQQNAFGSTALHAAARNGQIEVIELLLKRGAKVNQPDNRSYTVLHLAAGNGHAAAIELLLQYGAMVDQQNADGKTALHLAAWNGHRAAIESLLKRGAEVNQQNKFDRTALHLAAENRHVAAMELLLQHGATVDQKNAYGETALHLAAGNGHAAAIELLLQHRATVDQQNAHGETALHLAVNFALNKGHFYIVLCLLKRGADVSVVSEANRETVLQTAIRHRGNSEFGRLLIHEHLLQYPDIKAIKKLITEVSPNDDALYDSVIRQHERSSKMSIEFCGKKFQDASVELHLSVRDLLDRSKPNRLEGHGVRPKAACKKLAEILASKEIQEGCFYCLRGLTELLDSQEERVEEIGMAFDEFYAYKRLHAYQAKEDQRLTWIPGEIAEEILRYLSARDIRLFTDALSPSNEIHVDDATELCNPDMGIPSLKP